MQQLSESFGFSYHCTERDALAIQYRIFIRYRMQFAIRLLRHRGQLVPWREVAKVEPIVGDLRIEECMDKDLRRSRCVAKVIQDDNRGDRTPWPQLHDVRVVGMSARAFTLTGVERLGVTEYAQSWLVVGVPIEMNARLST